MRDCQREKAYKWERTCIARGLALPHIKDCQALVDLACESFNVKAPTVTDGRARVRGTYKAASNTIALPRLCRHERYVLHEASHAIMRVRDSVAPWHGAEFTAIMLAVCQWWGLARPNTRDRGIAMGLKIGGSHV